MATCMIKLLGKKGIIIIEVQYLMNTLKDLTFDNIYHEHYNYWSLTSLMNFFQKYPLKIFKAEKINTHGGSLRIYISKNKKIKIDKSINNFLLEEENFGIKKFETYKSFGEKVYEIRKNVLKNIDIIKKKEKSLVGLWCTSKSYYCSQFFWYFRSN